jgi:hypothetical protein
MVCINCAERLRGQPRCPLCRANIVEALLVLFGSDESTNLSSRNRRWQRWRQRRQELDQLSEYLDAETNIETNNQTTVSRTMIRRRPGRRRSVIRLSQYETEEEARTAVEEIIVQYYM